MALHIKKPVFFFFSFFLPFWLRFRHLSRLWFRFRHRRSSGRRPVRYGRLSVHTPVICPRGIFPVGVIGGVRGAVDIDVFLVKPFVLRRLITVLSVGRPLVTVPPIIRGIGIFIGRFVRASLISALFIGGIKEPVTVAARLSVGILLAAAVLSARCFPGRAACSGGGFP